MRKAAFLIIALSLAWVTQAGTLVNVEEAAEMTDLRISLNGPASARIFARVCDDCELLALYADNRTRIEHRGSTISLEQAAQLDASGATVLFNPASLRITRILYWK